MFFLGNVTSTTLAFCPPQERIETLLGMLHIYVSKSTLDVLHFVHNTKLLGGMRAFIYLCIYNTYIYIYYIYIMDLLCTYCVHVIYVYIHIYIYVYIYIIDLVVRDYQEEPVPKPDLPSTRTKLRVGSSCFPSRSQCG